MKFSGKMLLMIILKVTNKTPSLEDIFPEKPQKEFKLTPPPSLLRFNMVSQVVEKINWTNYVFHKSKQSLHNFGV